MLGAAALGAEVSAARCLAPVGQLGGALGAHATWTGTMSKRSRAGASKAGAKSPRGGAGAAAAAAAPAAGAGEQSISSFTADDIHGRPMALSRFKGKVCLIVNVASK